MSEFLMSLFPSPQRTTGKGVSRDGVELCDATVVKVENTKRHDRTPVIGGDTPGLLLWTVRHIRVGGTSLTDKKLSKERRRTNLKSL